MRGRTAGLAVVVGVLLLAGVTAARGQIYAPESLERYFRLEWTVKGTAKGSLVQGYVYNRGMLRADRMTLRIDRLDTAGAVIGTSSVWVLGEIPMDGRAYFEATVPAAPGYRVQVLSFDWAGRGGGA